ncbi:MAG: SDR family oxidoreductase [Paracoccaceae bacterium]|jgi:7-alpha-hydroxysteroid dehydrogenase|nr:SDR family oxidoreductase [Paracoccaceae bacterium]MDP5366098.1 SDR family oxidoreductase [Paracoccaceae bacterium]
MSFSISGKTAIVTGGAYGIGHAIGRHFLDKGANVVFADLDEDRLRKELGPNEDGNSHRYFAGDLRERLTIANLLSATIDAFDRVDILVNGARQIVTTDALDPEDTSVDTLLEQNLLTSLRLSQMVARRMIKQAEDLEEVETAGTIVNISCLAAQRTHPDLMGYSISTAALDQMTRSLALTLAPHRIRVNAVAFGSVMSASLKAAIKDNPDYRDQIIARTPLGRIAPPSELAEAVQYLASDCSSFMTGQIMTVDGGRGLLDPVIAPAH